MTKSVDIINVVNSNKIKKTVHADKYGVSVRFETATHVKPSKKKGKK